MSTIKEGEPTYAFEECGCGACRNKTIKRVHWRNIEENFKLFEKAKVEVPIVEEPKIKKFKDFLSAMGNFK